MKHIRALIKKIEAMTLDEFNEMMARFLDNSKTMDYLRNFVNIFKEPEAKKDDWHRFDTSNTDYNKKLLGNEDYNEFNKAPRFDWLDAWNRWKDNKDYDW